MKAILAVDEMGGLAYNGEMPWKFGEYKNDAVWFKNHTHRKTVIMGRKTFQSFIDGPLHGRGFNPDNPDIPLLGRHNIVVSSDTLMFKQKTNLRLCKFNHILGEVDSDVDTRDYWVIGGKQLISSFFKANAINEFYLSILPGFHLADTFWTPQEISDDMTHFNFRLDWETTLETGERFKIYKRRRVFATIRRDDANIP